MDAEPAGERQNESQQHHSKADFQKGWTRHVPCFEEMKRGGFIPDFPHAVHIQVSCGAVLTEGGKKSGDTVFGAEQHRGIRHRIAQPRGGNCGRQVPAPGHADCGRRDTLQRNGEHCEKQAPGKTGSNRVPGGVPKTPVADLVREPRPHPPAVPVPRVTNAFIQRTALPPDAQANSTQPGQIMLGMQSGRMWGGSHGN